MRKLVPITLLLVLLVIVGSGVFTFYAVFLGGNDVSMPKVEGLSVIEAVEILKKSELVARVDQLDSLKKPGTVLAQSPAEGTLVRKGKAVILKVSKGGRQVSLPDVRGMEYEQAVQTLQAEGFTPGDVVRVADKNLPAGAVVAQSPASPAAVPAGMRVDLLVSYGGGAPQGLVKVPELAGRPEKEARKMLEDGGLRVGGVRYQYTLATPPGLVVRMSPSPGTKVSKGSRVELVVSTADRAAGGKTPTPQGEGGTGGDSVGPPPGTVRVPVVGVPPRAEGEEGVPPQVGPTVVAAPPKGEEPPKKATPAPEGGSRGKKAKIRYQVPPLVKPMNLRIEVVDRNGTRSVLDKTVQGGEYIKLEETYAQEAVVTIYLGGEFVWQDRYQ